MLGLPQLLMSSHKLPWHFDRVEAWERRERIAPVTIDMALTQACQLRCRFCYAQLQRNKGHAITEPIIDAFLSDCARMGVRAISLLSDGESTLSPVFVHTIQTAADFGIPIASGSNCVLFTREMQEGTLPYLSYIRINLPAGERERYAQICGVGPQVFDLVCQNVQDMVRLKRRDNLGVTLGLQMVLMPEDADQIIPFVKLAKGLAVDYAIIKHCADDEYGGLGIDYAKYHECIPMLKEAGAYASDGFQVSIQWEKMLTAGARSYQRCYGPPFMLQISGSGLVAPCGDKFGTQYGKRFHIGNICEQRFYDIWQGERYWQVMDYLRSEEFDAQRECGPLCRQHPCNTALDNHLKHIERIEPAAEGEPHHVNFI